MTSLRILVVTNMYPPHHLGGYELSCEDTVERWRRAGHNVDVLTTTFRVPTANDALDRRVRRELEFYWRNHEMLRPSPLARWRIERHNQQALAHALDDVRPDVVSVWHMGAMSLGLLQTITEHNLPMVFVVCDDWLVYGQAVDAWTSAFARRPKLGTVVERISGIPTSVRLDPGSIAMCFNSEWVRQRAIERSGWQLDRTTVVYSGIETSDFEPRADSDRCSSWRLLCVGRVEERKGVHVALEALTHLPEPATLEVVGPADDGYLERLRRSAGALGVADRVRFTGPLPRRALAERYHAADVFVFPVLWDEPFGLVPLEAMACGVPVVATATGGSAEFLIDGANCVRVAPGDAREVAEATRRLADDAELRRKLVEAGYTTASHLTVDQLAQALEAWHLAAAERFRKGVPPDREPINAVLQRASRRDEDV